MRASSIVPLLLFLGLSAAAQQAQPAAAPLTPFEQEAINNVQQYLKAFATGDRAWFERVLTSDFVYIGTSGEAAGKAEILEYVRPPEPAPASHQEENLAMGPPRFYGFQVLTLNDGAAIVSFNAVVPGRPRYQHFSTAWARQAGEWKLKFVQSTPNLWSLGD